MSQEQNRIDREQLPSDYPTHRHSGEFWEQLGRTVATYGFLEQVLGRAIFALTATRKYGHDELEEAYSKWPDQLERALSDPLRGLISAYGKVLKNRHQLPVSNSEQLIEDLHHAAQLRNVLCHGSWQVPDVEGKSLPLFVDKKLELFATPIDIAYLQQVRGHVVSLACEVIDSVSSMGLQFPGSAGPGEVILKP
ncbi:hypothetical protein [Pseudomonas syringae]|uniref:hypothetical protein n=1 Tax=Pseudomonas syringae TaxID=317 RepID=UPI001BCBBA41|nr:hypothetical protein [Pseudomonas syringae]MBS7437906.1 hypothetical protein [Pseudomonas syringae]MBS7461929.1 hypothetical protein [Pseudomonas syringae]